MGGLPTEVKTTCGMLPTTVHKQTFSRFCNIVLTECNLPYTENMLSQKLREYKVVLFSLHYPLRGETICW